MDERSNKARAVKSSIGVVGALATIISVWWFALRPRRHHGESDAESGFESEGDIDS